MSYRFARTMLSAACLLLPAAAVAADLIPVEDFARHVLVSDPALSPNGQYIAVNLNDPDGDSHALAVYRVNDTTHPISLLRLPKYETAADIIWVSDTRIVVAKGKQQGSIDKPYLTGELIATDLDGKNQDYLYGFNSAKYGKRAGSRGTDEGWGFFSGKPTPANGHFYMRTESWNDNTYSTLYDVDATRNTRHLIGQISVHDMSFMVGADGQARFAYGRNVKDQYVVYRRDNDGWKQLSAAQIGGTFTPIHFTPDENGIYAQYDAGGGPSSLVSQDENGGNRKVLAHADFGSVGRVQWTPYPYQPFATAPLTGVPDFTYIDPTTPVAKLHRALTMKFPGEYVDFVQFSQDGSELLFFVGSDRDPGTYYLINTQNYKVNRLFNVEPWVVPAKMAERRPLRFKNRNGKELEAILTVPNSDSKTSLPMILFPHGGPIDVNDDWFYDSEAQFLASRGYLVLQVNFRGSSSRGVDFAESGYKQWGTGIQNDLIDSVKWAIAEKYAAPDRVCVFGASFGGYSALMAPIVAPGMFKCSIGYAGVYDIGMLYKKGDTRQSTAGLNAMKLEIGDNQAELSAISPANMADKIDIPVLLVHGEDDQRAPFAQAKAMRAALDAAHKPYEWMSKPGEGHGFYDEKNNVEFLNKLQDFIGKHIGPGVKTN